MLPEPLLAYTHALDWEMLELETRASIGPKLWPLLLPHKASIDGRVSTWNLNQGAPFCEIVSEKEPPRFSGLHHHITFAFDPQPLESQQPLCIYEHLNILVILNYLLHFNFLLRMVGCATAFECFQRLGKGSLRTWNLQEEFAIRTYSCRIPHPLSSF
jgi:hypothetical protein